MRGHFRNFKACVYEVSYTEIQNICILRMEYNIVGIKVIEEQL